MHKTPELAANSLSIGESIIMGVAGAAPAFSISAAVVALVASILRKLKVLSYGFSWLKNDLTLVV